jgi:hypothetical protein
VRQIDEEAADLIIRVGHFKFIPSGIYSDSLAGHGVKVHELVSEATDVRVYVGLKVQLAKR